MNIAAAATLTEACASRHAVMIDDIRTVIEVESPASVPESVAASARTISQLITDRLGRAPEPVTIDGFSHLRLRFGKPRVLILAHHDTVWPLGTLDELPFSVNDGVIRGPGCFDMKVGLVQAIHAMGVLREIGGDDALDGVCLLVTGDEEIGSFSSRALIESEASGCRAALVLEASGDGAALKIERKGVSLYRINVIGRAAHAGLEPEKGINASIALSHLIIEISGLADPELGTSVTPTVMAAGVTTNTVPAAGFVDVDVRASTAAEQERVDSQIRGLRPRIDGAEFSVSGGVNRPPLESASAVALFERASALAGRLGQDPPRSIAVGGASDGNFTAGIGVPTLDGLGAVGGGAHATNEHALVEWIAPRTALLAALVRDVLDDEM